MVFARRMSRPAGRLAAIALVGAALSAVSGCASTSGWDYAAEPGVPAELTMGSNTISGTLVGLEHGALLFETEVARGEDVEVVRRDGIDYVYVGGVVSGTATEIRDFDIVMRRSVLLRDTDELAVKTRGYLGWGSAVAGGLTFFLVKVLAETEW